MMALVVLAACAGDDDDSSGSSADPPATTTTTTLPSPEHPLDDTLRYDQVQLLASHNSYKAEPYAAVFDELRDDIPDTIAGLEYFHRPLTEQFDELGVRAIELDVWADPEGGKYAAPAFPASVGVVIPDDPAMRAPGFKVMHQNEIDTHATCVTLVLCLTRGARVVGSASRARADDGPARSEGRSRRRGRARRARCRDPVGVRRGAHDHARRRPRRRRDAGRRRRDERLAGARRDAREGAVHARQRRPARPLPRRAPVAARTRAVHAVVAGRRGCRVRQAERSDRRRGRDPSCARRAHARAHPRRRRHDPVARERHDERATPRSRAARSS